MIGLQLLRCCAAYLLSAVDHDRAAGQPRRDQDAHGARPQRAGPRRELLPAGRHAGQPHRLRERAWCWACCWPRRWRRRRSPACTCSPASASTTSACRRSWPPTRPAPWARSSACCRGWERRPGRAAARASRIDFEVGRKSVRKLGALRPLTGRGVRARALLRAAEQPAQHSRYRRANSQVYFYLVVGFLAGFSERVTKVLLTTTADKVLPGSGDPTSRRRRRRRTTRRRRRRRRWAHDAVIRHRRARPAGDVGAGAGRPVHAQPGRADPARRVRRHRDRGARHRVRRDRRQGRPLPGLEGQGVRPGAGRAAEPDHALRPARGRREGVPRRQLVRPQAVHRARLLARRRWSRTGSATRSARWPTASTWGWCSGSTPGSCTSRCGQRR